MKGHTQVYKLIEMFSHIWMKALTLCNGSWFDYHGNSQELLSDMCRFIRIFWKVFLDNILPQNGTSPCQRVGATVFDYIWFANQSHNNKVCHK